MSKHNHHHKNAAGSSPGGTWEPKGHAEGVRKDPDNAETGHTPPREDIGDVNPAAGSEPASAERGSAEQSSRDQGSGQGSAEPNSTEQKYAELEVKFAELNNQYLRKAADFENFRKRMNKEKQEIVEFSNQSLLLDLLPVIDDFERAIKSAQTSQDFASFYEGVTMIEKRLSVELENKWGLKRFDSEGQVFDPNRHEALQMEKAAGIQEAVVKDDFVKGYFLKDRVIRFAKVKVLVPDGSGESGTGNEQ